MVVREKKQKQCQEELEVGDCWVGLSLTQQSGLILAARVGKHTDQLLLELVVSTEGKTTCQDWNTDGWGGYKRVLPETVDHYIGKALTQRVERTIERCANKRGDGIDAKINLASDGIRQ